MTKLFISYSHIDKSLCKELVDLLKLVFSDVWYDRDLVTGTLWAGEINQQIEACDHFLFLLSPEACTSRYCLSEFYHAQKHQKHIIPVRIRAGTVPPPELATIQYINWHDEFMQEGFANIAGTILCFDDEKRSPERMILQHDEVILQELWEYLDERKHNHFLSFPQKRAVNGNDSFYLLEIYTFKRRRMDFTLLNDPLEALFCALDVAILKFLATFSDYTLEPSAVDEFFFFDVDRPEVEQTEQHLRAQWNDIREQHRRVFRRVRLRYPEFFDEK